MTPQQVLDTYGHWVSQYWAQWLPEYDYRWGVAQIYVESAGDPTARSQEGALGLAQFLPSTWKDVQQRLNFPSYASPLDPQYALQGFAYYMAACTHSWHAASRTTLDRLHLGAATYNCGMGYLLQAQKLAGGANDYLSIVNALPQVPDVDYKQVTDYVYRIGTVYLTLTDGNIPPSP